MPRPYIVLWRYKLKPKKGNYPPTLTKIHISLWWNRAAFCGMNPMGIGDTTTVDTVPLMGLCSGCRQVFAELYSRVSGC